MPDGKLGLVSCGTGMYNKDMKNLTAQRRSQRFAYVQAFMNAKANMVRFFNGASSESLASFVYDQDGGDSETGGTFSSSKTEISNKSVAAAVLRGYVTYNVRDDFENSTVYVTLVSTPRTQGRYSRPTGDTQMAETLDECLNAILAEIQNGVVPPVGGRIVEVPKTGEIAFVGFGSAVVRNASQPAARANLRRSARKIAGLRAQSALCGIITGEKIEASLSKAEKTEQSFTETEGEYEKLKDPIDELEPDEDKAAAEKFKAGKFEDALAVFHQIRYKDWAKVKAYLGAAECFLKMEKPDDASSLTLELIQALSADMKPEELAAAARILHRSGRKDEGFSVMEQAYQKAGKAE